MILQSMASRYMNIKNQVMFELLLGGLHIGKKPFGVGDAFLHKHGLPLGLPKMGGGGGVGGQTLPHKRAAGGSSNGFLLQLMIWQRSSSQKDDKMIP